jgi:hypothetical protein
MITKSLSKHVTPAQRSPARRWNTGVRSCGAKATAIGHIIALLALGGCTPPTEVIDLRNVPQATQDAMLQVRILPLGMPAPPGVGSIGPVTGYGCAQTPEDARSDAVRQLQVKAMGLHATAVVDVLIGPGGATSCVAGFGMIASGVAVGPRGIPSSY